MTAVLLAVAFGAARARGAESDVVVAVDCPAYDEETRAALEARARAELIVRAAAGTLVVACRDGHAELTWHPLSGPPASAGVALDPAPRTSIERVLEALDAVLTALAPMAAPVAAPDVAPREPVTPPPPEPVPAAPASIPPGADQQAFASRARARSEWRGIAAGAAVRGELWARTEALGPSARVEVPLPRRLAAFLSVTGLWALRSPQSVDARVVRLAAGGAFGLDSRERFRVGADAFVDVVHAASNGAGSDDRVVGGASIFANAALPVGPVRLEVGPTLAFHPQEVQFRVGELEAMHVPRFALGLSLGAELGPFR